MTRTRLRPELQHIIPQRMRNRPIDRRGYSVPWFVERINGVPDFRVMDQGKWHRAVVERRCWICGSTLGKLLSFPIGPMCMVNRITGEPPAHMGCALYAVQGCPFLKNPAAKYRSANLPEDAAFTPGMINHNPGLTVIWTTRGYTVTSRELLISLDDDPEDVSFWTEGRTATRAEVITALRRGLPKLRAAAEDSCAARAELRRLVLAVQPLLPGDPAPDEAPLLSAEDWLP